MKNENHHLGLMAHFLRLPPAKEPSGAAFRPERKKEERPGRINHGQSCLNYGTHFDQRLPRTAQENERQLYEVT